MHTSTKRTFRRRSRQSQSCRHAAGAQQRARRSITFQLLNDGIGSFRFRPFLRIDDDDGHGRLVFVRAETCLRIALEQRRGRTHLVRVRARHAGEILVVEIVIVVVVVVKGLIGGGERRRRADFVRDVLVQIVMEMVVQPMAVLEVGVDVQRRVLAHFAFGMRMFVVRHRVAVPVRVKVNRVLNRNGNEGDAAQENGFTLYRVLVLVVSERMQQHFQQIETIKN